MVVEIVEADLAPGNDLRVFRQPLQLVEVFLPGQLRFVRMNADGGVHALMLLRELNGAVERAGPGPSPLPMASRVVTPAPLRAREDIGAIGIEAFVLEMAVRVGVHVGDW